MWQNWGPQKRQADVTENAGHSDLWILGCLHKLINLSSLNRTLYCLWCEELRCCVRSHCGLDVLMIFTFLHELYWFLLIEVFALSHLATPGPGSPGSYVSGFHSLLEFSFLRMYDLRINSLRIFQLVDNWVRALKDRQGERKGAVWLSVLSKKLRSSCWNGSAWVVQSPGDKAKVIVTQPPVWHGVVTSQPPSWYSDVTASILA